MRIKPAHIVILVVLSVFAYGGYLDDRKRARERAAADTAATDTLRSPVRRLARCGWSCQAGRREAGREFETVIREYMRIANSSSGFVPADSAQLQGRLVVIVDHGPGIAELDDLHFELPDSLRAATPEQVGTIVVLKYDRIQVGRYTDGAAAYQFTSVVVVVDKKTGRVIARNTLYGPPPPAQKRGLPLSAAEGAKPSLEVLDYMLGLPRQPD